MKISTMPKDSAGKWAVYLSVLFVVLMVLKFTQAVRLPLPSPLIALFAIAGLVLSLISIFLHKGRAILLLIPVLVGLLVAAWTTAELMFPH
ncbi:hypothetical protein [Acidaminobacter sp.]|uniref:hypothetical protein n=1 Tax=Acidaminobacter sp. TaxID=1872102 RepID=UPI0013804981|nr:hypothetical protein [Acidaminobacter sp.]MDK9711336.1 hypothetical protein [Acidaminobacter sp.]MZQ97143.1 hypothetical protein [Acidaminobacter sp.]